MNDYPGASDQILQTVRTWPGVEVGLGRRGETSIRLGRREIGHLHGDHAAHFNFPKAQWDELISAGRIDPHPVFPDARGPAARRIRNAGDVADVLALLRLNYDRYAASAAVVNAA